MLPHEIFERGDLLGTLLWLRGKGERGCRQEQRAGQELTTAGPQSKDGFTGGGGHRGCRLLLCTRNMDPKHLMSLLETVRNGQISVEQAMQELADLPFRDLGFAQVDHHRHLRAGFPEVVLGTGKTAEQIAKIVAELARTGANVLA